MVSECGLSDAIGPLYIEDGSVSEQTKQRVDEEVGRIVRGAKDEVMAMLSENIKVCVCARCARRRSAAPRPLHACVTSHEAASCSLRCSAGLSGVAWLHASVVLCALI